MDDSPVRHDGSVPVERFRPWVLALGVALIPLNSYWIARTEAQDYSGFPTCASLFYNVVFCILVLIGMNALVRRFRPGWALCRRELMVLYAMMATGSSLVGHDYLQMLVPTIPHVAFFGNTGNKLPTQVAPLLPDWLVIADNIPAVQRFSIGHSTLYSWENFSPWIRPLSWWALFLIAVLLGTLCINLLLRRHWQDHERLTYPVVQVPMLITEGGGANGLFRSRVFWIGFSIAAGLDVYNGIAQLFPAFPPIPLKLQDIGPIFAPYRPWNAMGWTPISFYPWVIGLSYFMPTNMAFSCWFFYFVRKAQMVIASAMGYTGGDPWFPYLKEQAFGAAIALFVMALWFSRHHLKQVFLSAVGCGALKDDDGVSYRWVLVTLGICLAVVLGFLIAAGMKPWLAVVYVMLYLMFVGACTRIRAELGVPAHEFGWIGPYQVLAGALGTQILGPQSLAVFALLWFQNRMHRGLLMPQQAECLKAAKDSGLKLKWMVTALVVAGVVGVVSAFWAMLHLSYARIHPAHVHPGAPGSGFSAEAFAVLQSYLNNNTGVDSMYITGLGIGAFVAAVLYRLSVTIYGFPFHPAGYAVGMAFGLDYIWMPILISWTIKVITVRIWGLKGYRAALPFFVGLIVGEFVVGGLWSFLRGLTGIPMYTFFY